jgi:hydrogenase-4 membrane subunit HyfE
VVVDAVLIASSVVLMLDARLRTALVAYAAFTATTLGLAMPRGGELAVLVFAAIAGIKLIVVPALLLFIVRRYGVPEYLAPSFGFAWRVILALVAIVAGHEAGRMAGFAGVALAGAVFTAVFSSVGTVVLHRNLLAHVIGLLALGSSITLAGSVFAPGLSGGVELADTFDVVIATFVALAVARALIAFDPKLDVRSLRSLRG